MLNYRLFLISMFKYLSMKDIKPLFKNFYIVPPLYLLTLVSMTLLDHLLYLNFIPSIFFFSLAFTEEIV